MGILGPSGLFFVYFMLDFISFNIYYFPFTTPIDFLCTFAAVSSTFKNLFFNNL